MKKIIFLLLLTVAIITPWQKASAAAFYAQPCIITELYPGEIAILTQYDNIGIGGDEWYVYNTENLRLFDRFILLIDDKGTETRSDDTITNMFYIGGAQ